MYSIFQSVAQFAEVTPWPISPTPQYKITKLEKGIGATHQETSKSTTVILKRFELEDYEEKIDSQQDKCIGSGDVVFCSEEKVK